jgi:hypothetical protein
MGRLKKKEEIKLPQQVLLEILNRKDERRYNAGSILYEIYKDNGLDSKMTFDEFYDYANNMEKKQKCDHQYGNKYGEFSKFF